MTATGTLRERRKRRERAARRSAAFVAIGCSLGGLHALQVVLRGLPSSFRIPVAIAQHRHSTSTEVLSHYLQRYTTRPVVDAEDQQPIEPGQVYLAPANYHLMVEEGRFRLSTEGAVLYSRPSIDVLFESAADAFGASLVAMVLTGANEDGAHGAARVKTKGGVVIAQNPEEAEAPAMPSAAIRSCGVDAVLRLAEMPAFLAKFDWTGEE